MNFIRGQVSQSKTRYQQDGFNLDLTYITPRIIAMSMPAEGLESFYRNPIDEVKRLLDRYHPENYLVVNASNRKYDVTKFNSRVYTIRWADHYPCPFRTYVECIIELSNFLASNTPAILAVHCHAGKGRTGSLICAILFNSGVF